MNLWQWIAGIIRVRLTCADREGAIQTIIRAGIVICEGVESDELSLCFRIPAGKWQLLSRLADQKGWELIALERSGLPCMARKWLSRPLLLLGLAVLMAATVYLPGRVLFVQVEGNSTVPTRLILEQASRCGIGFGASRRDVRSQKMKDALLDALPQLQWAGVNTAGCLATVTVRELAEEAEPEDTSVSSIVADRDGILTEITVTQGTPRFTVGQAVQAGQVLISGYTDCGFCIRAQRAQGEVFAMTQRDLSAVTPTDWAVERENQGSVKKFAIIFGKKRINFYKCSGISGTTCDKMYSEYYITLPGGFRLPVCIVTEVWTFADSAAVSGSDDAEQLLSDFASDYLRQLMTAGTVIHRREEWTAEDGIYTMKGNYACIEMIGRQRNEEKFIGKYD